ncbi:983_t:CDS:2 [Acaulospora colombiana]|uniref:983_t:CDS:1 n=1 Tax=Acaulospora colombiana TaxID=27376 RepID=A0ACA9L533_9GLOM|nr:983_t:CDS:2 [Acaulospora colombiana]
MSLRYKPRKNSIRKPKVNPLSDLIGTERKYLDNLKMLLQRVTSPWSSDNLPPPGSEALFQCMEEIYKINQNFYLKLAKLGGDKKSAKDLGDTLINWIDEMEGSYTDYCLEFQQVIGILPEIEGHVALQQALSDISAEINLPVSLGFFTEMPMKRIRYYKRLYSRMLNLTEPGCSDHEILLTANNRIDALIELGKRSGALTQNGKARVLADIPARNSSPPKTSTVIPPVLRNKKKFDSLENHENTFPVVNKESPSVAEQPREDGLKQEDRSNQDSSEPQLTKVWTLSELEKCIDYSRVIDLISREVRNMSVSLLPQNLPFDRRLVLHSDFVMEIPKIQESQGSTRAYINAHIFLLTDLMLICQPIEPEVKRKNPDLEFYLLYPPLSGRHLSVADISDEGEMIEISLLNKETLVLFPADAETKLAWLNELSKIIEFANNPRRTISSFVRNTRLLHGLKKSSSLGTLSRSPSYREAGGQESESPEDQYVTTKSDHKTSTGADFASSPDNTKPVVPHDNRSDSKIISTQIPLETGVPKSGEMMLKIPSKTELLPYGNLTRSNTTSKVGLPVGSNRNRDKKGMRRSSTPEPPRGSGGKYPGDYTPSEIIKDRSHIQERNSDPTFNSPTRELTPITRERSIRSTRSVEKFEEIICRISSRSVDRWGDGRWEPLTVEDDFIAEVKITSANAGCWTILLQQTDQMILNSWIHPGTTIHLDSPTHVSISCDIGQSMEYYRVTCLNPEDAERFFENLNRVKSLSNKNVVMQGILKSRSSSLQKSEVKDTRVSTMRWYPLTRLDSLQSSETEDQEPDFNSEQMMEEKIKVFLQKGYGAWTNLGWGTMNLSVEASQRKRIIINSNKQKAKLIDAILLDDGVERIGKTNIAITLNRIDTTRRIVYMMQLKDEKTAERTFRFMKKIDGQIR